MLISALISALISFGEGREGNLCVVRWGKGVVKCVDQNVPILLRLG